jgi:hypothetical protein
MEIIINKQFGGYRWSREASVALGMGKDLREGFNFGTRDESLRTRPDAIALLKEWGSDRCSGKYAKLEVIEIPDGVEYEIDEYDGMETVHELSRKWG